jgi:hypothetical protein
MTVTVGIAGMGGIAISKRALGRLSFVPLAQAAILAGIFFTGGDSGGDPLQITFTVLFGISWMLLGVALWNPREDTPGAALPV